ncbi:hypothetical protein ABMA27_004590 [Loxostege sticticalis]|uniref:CCHC-type domain-containing protein n=1 Tax=Loxostege sticticalis TaxID=481309 RepID=A0ABR3HP67_LOXSC
MSGTQFGLLTVFDHNSNDWKTYKSRLTQWFVANDITGESDKSGTKRRAILLSALTESTYKLASDLALPKELDQDEVLKLLDEHFTPKRLGFGERSKFYAASQNPGETFVQWAARLRGLTAHCSFKDIEEALRDRFVMGMLAGPERDKLFVQDLQELTFAKAVELAETLRCARAGSSTSQQDRLFKINQDSVKVSKASERCSVCGRSNHSASKCRFANYKCNKCNTKGHLKKMCQKVNYVEASNSGGEVGEDDGKLFNISSRHGEPMVEKVTVLGLPIQFEVDSGSSVTLVSDVSFRKWFPDVPLSPTTKKLMTYIGDNIECVGVARLPVTYLHQTHDLDFYVVHGVGPPLLGRDFISQFKLELLPCKFVSNGYGESIKQQLQTRFPEVFSDKLGAFNKYKVKLQLKPEAKPVFFKARPIAFALKDKIDNEIDRLVQLGVLKPVDHSDFASPIVPVLKRNGTVRLCADYSVSINKFLVVEQYPLPTIHELFSKLYGGEQFSKIDLSMAYNQFILDEDSQAITCINTHRGLFKYTRMVFGLSSAPSIRLNGIKRKYFNRAFNYIREPRPKHFFFENSG